MNERIIALDVGDRRIGVAVSDPLGITAQPVETYTRVGYGPDVRHMLELAKQYDTNLFLCGLPRNMDGSQGFQTQKVREFAAKLEEAGMMIDFYDERMTTVMAEGALLEANMSRENRKKKVDMLAAVMILQSYLDACAFARAADDGDEEEADDGILEMEDEDGNVIPFILSAQIAYQGQEYVLLTVAQAAGDVEMDESFIMRITQDQDGNDCYQSLDDEALIAQVYEQYLKNSEENA